MIKIDSEKCIGCGQCVLDCFSSIIKLKDGKAVHGGRPCMECGHCKAICPANAVTMEGYDESEILEFKDFQQEVDTEKYLNHLKGRRSIRRYKEEPVCEEDIKKIIEAGRYSPTGGNLQNVAYHVFRKDIHELKDKVVERLYELGTTDRQPGNPAIYERLWVQMYKDYKENGRDRLFFNAGTVILVSSDAAVEACLAAAHMETMVYSLGLGMLYSGFTSRAITSSQEIKEYLNLKEGYNVFAVLVIGHPDVKYVRTAPRREAVVDWR